MTTPNPSTFPPPASAADFELALRRGHGRAVLWLRQGDIAEDRDLILKACRENWAFDPQTEDNRALYMADIVWATSEPEFYTQSVIESLFAKREEHSFHQIYDLLGRFAAAGSIEAREAVYLAFTKLRTDYSSSYAEVLMDIDGLSGYRFAVQTWAREGLTEDDDFSEIDLLNQAEERFGADAVAALVEDLSQSDPNILPYLASVKARQAAWRERLETRAPRPAPTYEQLREMLGATRSNLPWTLSRRARKMERKTALRLASDVLSEPDRKILSNLLFCFGEYEFPGDPETLISKACDDDGLITLGAVFALGAVTHPFCRHIGLDILEWPHAIRYGVRLFKYNFEPGDSAPMMRLLQRTEDLQDVHLIGIEIRDVFEKNPLPEFAELLTLLYERGPCALCRSSVVECLASIGPLPECILLEGPYDACDITREFIAELLDDAPNAS